MSLSLTQELSGEQVCRSVLGPGGVVGIPYLYLSLAVLSFQDSGPPHPLSKVETLTKHLSFLFFPVLRVGDGIGETQISVKGEFSPQRDTETN